MDNYFELLGIPQRFELSLEDLDQRWKTASAKVHPDRFAWASAAEKKTAMVWATRINDAYQTLKDPIKRASYLCQLHGVEIESETNTAMSPEFLMKQMQLRESIDMARSNPQAMQALKSDLNKDWHQLIQQLANALDQEKDFVRGATLVREGMFLQKVFKEFN
ncbi:Fe-S protein assembly co-chaperone HscB [Basilea psittacipulmonis]|uniref:Co-chaperone protein HscB homolog n=1 Tax=Basilea psittacipulmonis DSM 24701 TaxID=1072685 RepID=A0A077DDJ1_9BURK|nr:Fe-S protein assembly co-chaperone HscB [Basilea psittacipulmonis]AIL32689.1 hypothetical protein IX83_04640 [Basilea psittacipulmonis DSM 24701]